MTPIPEQVAHIQRQIDALAEQIRVQAKRKSLDDTPDNSDTKAVGLNQYRARPGKA